MKVSNEGTFECTSVADAVDGPTVASGLVVSFYQLIRPPKDTVETFVSTKPAPRLYPTLPHGNN